ncbi:SurA N-terminal domain-containing protein [Phytoactinopolyspora halotolerans]|uniref:SurA N-terminal domain-containing protein n=1 Tax=Phytoactinopolyspora halotolerans TaxID=1981512 RepID=A0A6L9S2I7_9ACTN|nr:SurA N-terminal domain-containing protein [Phytoactinopolyspora halotolerans]NED99674.1 hypothetical protein [Phytoactinopolyspora halotolerans]
MTAVVAAASLVAACDPDQVGAAAIVDDDRLTVDELQDEVTDTIDTHNEVAAQYELDVPPLPAEGGDVTELQNTVLGRWIENRMFDAVAAEQDIDVSEADVDDFLAEWSQQFENGDFSPFYAQENFTPESLRAEVRKTLIYQELTGSDGDQAAAQQVINEVMEQLEIDVNPRYGTWTETGLSPESGSVSQPFEGDALDAPAQPQ